MTDDTRHKQKGKRRRVVAEVKQAQAAAAAPKAKAKRRGRQSPPREGRPSRAMEGADRWLAKIRNAFGAKAAKDVFDMVGDPGRDVLTLCNKLLTTYAFALLTAQRQLKGKIGTVGEAGARAYLEDIRINAKAVKDICNALIKVRAQYVDEDLDSRPSVIELVGAESLRSQMTTVTDAPTDPSIN